MVRMRDAARKMEEKHFSDRTNEHVEFLPVEWRSKLTLDGGIVYGQALQNKVHYVRKRLSEISECSR